MLKRFITRNSVVLFNLVYLFQLPTPRKAPIIHDQEPIKGLHKEKSLRDRWLQATFAVSCPIPGDEQIERTTFSFTR